MRIELRKLSAEDGQDIYDMLQEIPETENGYGNPAYGITYDEYRNWLKRKEEESKQTELMDGWKVPSTKYWLYVDERPVGVGDIRHFLTPALRKAGGNIGYAICPGERGKGYGKKLLSLLLDEARKMGLEQVLITIHPGNNPSIAVVKANGGNVMFENDERIAFIIALADFSEIRIETKDLVLKKARFEDWKNIYNNLWCHKESSKYMLWNVTESEDAAKDRMNRTIEFEKINKYALLVYLKETDEAIGFAGMRELEPKEYEETGIALGPEYVGKGYGKQILNALIEEAKRNGATKFMACARTQNVASHNLQMACGFEFESFSEEMDDPRNGEKYILEKNIKLLIE